MYVPTMIVTVCIVIADLMGQWRSYVRTHDDWQFVFNDNTNCHNHRGYVYMATTVPLSQQWQYKLSQSSWVRTYDLHCPSKSAMTIQTVTTVEVICTYPRWLTVCIVIADLMGEWRSYVRTHDDCDSLYCHCWLNGTVEAIRTYDLHCPIKEAMTIQTVTIIVDTYI
jgi:hypothetical protein